MAVLDLPWAMIALSSGVAALSYGIIRLINERRFYKDLVCRTAFGYHFCGLRCHIYRALLCPTPPTRTRRLLTCLQPKPPHSLFWGHLKLLGETFKLLPNDCHYQAAVTTIARKYNMPEVFYLDLWPAAAGQVVVTNPDVALHMTAIRNHPKHEAEKHFIDPLIGAGNIVTTDGARWKYLHKMRMQSKSAN